MSLAAQNLIRCGCDSENHKNQFSRNLSRLEMLFPTLHNDLFYDATDRNC